MVSVQAEGCAPIPRAFDQGTEFAEPWKDPHTVAAGLRVPGAVGDFLMLRAVRETGGTAMAVSDDELMRDTRELASAEGIFSSPEGGASVSCLKRMLADGSVKATDRVIVFITGSGYKYLDVLEKYV
jgi:threonine synthase